MKSRAVSNILWQMARWAALSVLLVLVSACATPIGVVRGTTQEVHYALTANVLSAGEPSSWTCQVLQRNNLLERFKADPEATLSALRRILAQPSGEEQVEDHLFALSELSFLYAEESGRTEHYRAAAVYAYAFLNIVGWRWGSQSASAASRSSTEADNI